MNVTLKLYATLSDYLPPDARNNQVQVEVPEDATVGNLIGRYNLPPKLTHLVLINGHYIAPEARTSTSLRDGDTVAVWPPIAGG
ncbi:MAG: MoaD/ThiS family protein [Gemmatimonadota bacterium]